MIQHRFEIYLLYLSSMLVGSVLVTSLSMYNATASTNTTTNATADSNNTVVSNTTSTEKLNVITSVSPITNIVKNVAGERVILAGLVPEGVNSHTFELVPSDAVKINNADLVIIDGLGLEVNIEDVVDQAQNTNPDLQILKLGDNTITPDQYVFDFSFPKEAVILIRTYG